MSNGTMADEDFNRIMAESGEGPSEDWVNPDEKMAGTVDQTQAQTVTPPEGQTDAKPEGQEDSTADPKKPVLSKRAAAVSKMAEKLAEGPARAPRPLGTYATPALHRQSVYGK